MERALDIYDVQDIICTVMYLNENISSHGGDSSVSRILFDLLIVLLVSHARQYLINLYRFYLKNIHTS